MKTICLQHCHVATLATLHSSQSNPYGIIENAAVVVLDKTIEWVGAYADLPSQYQALPQKDLNGYWLTPSLIDCHTHLVYASNRDHEFEARLNGVSYETIAAQGGGILSSVKATRAASEEELFEQSLPRLQSLIQEGVQTIEIKSGYGLDLATERKMLRVAKRLGNHAGVRVKTTFLGAHALPPEYKNRSDDYINLVCKEMLPSLHQEGLVDAVDVFCEKIGFSPAQTERVFQSATELGIRVKIHAEQLSNLEGAALAARYKALSADHLEYLSESGINAMKDANMVAVMLPAAFYFLRETKLPPIDALRLAGVPMAVSTDSNPGTSPITSLLTSMNMACVQFRMTPLESLLGVTRYAAKALGLDDQLGMIASGFNAEMTLWDIQHPRELSTRIQSNRKIPLTW